MKKTVLVNWNEIKVIDEAMPTLDEGEALVKLIYGGICGTDIHVHSHKHASATIPRVLGHEYCGEIVEVNSKDPTDLKPGDFVTSHPLNACGKCAPCLMGRENVCVELEIYGVHTDGCFSEYFKVPINKVFKINKEIDPVVAVLIEPLAVALHDVRLSNLKRGQSVFIVSAGPIGLLIAIVARQCGASNIVISEPNKYRIELAKSMGFTVLDPTEKDFESKLFEENDGAGYDVIFEVSGTKQGIELMTKAAVQCATLVIVGVPGENYQVDTGAFLAKELNAIGVRIHNRYAYKEAVDAVNSGIFNEELKKMVTNIFPLEQIQEAISFSIEDKNHFKVLLKP